MKNESKEDKYNFLIYEIRGYKVILDSDPAMNPES
jgi:hypothetical protein